MYVQLSAGKKKKTQSQSKKTRTPQELLDVLEIFSFSETDKTILMEMLPWKIMVSPNSLSCLLPSPAMPLSFPSLLLLLFPETSSHVSPWKVEEGETNTVEYL